VSGTINQLFRPLAIEQPDPQQVSLADAWTANTRMLGDYLAQQQAEAQQRGLWTGGQVWEGGHPTAAGATDAANQYAQGVLMGTTAPGSPGFTAYHGSPHDFSAFDTSKIGTGEGAQAYGHGLYFAGNEGVAKGYRDALAGRPTASGVQVDGIPAEDAGMSPSAISLAKMHLDGFQTLDNMRTSNEASLQKALELLQRQPTNTVGIMNRDMASRSLDALDELKGRKLTFEQPRSPGHMYEVNIAADPAHFLDWDKPLSEQSPHVQDRLSDIIAWQKVPRKNNVGAETTGGQMMQYLQQRFNDDPVTAAAELRDAGIPGIRYLDAGSRNAPKLSDAARQQLEAAIADKQRLIADPRQQRDIATHQADLDLFKRRLNEADNITSNHVVFDASTIDILRKYGIAGLLAGGGAAATVGQSQPQQ
jgi:hypothetical protein